MAFVETPRSVSKLFSIFLGGAGKWTPLLAECGEMCQYYFSISTTNGHEYTLMKNK
jgi:hypothetical protein